MIARINGRVTEKGNNYLHIDVGGICYEVFVPTAVMQRLQDQAQVDSTVSLITYHYLQMEPSRGVPVIIGFMNEVEKEFFEIFITVSGIGPRAALKALNKPISLIAKAIDEGDTEFLRSLPGIGTQRAKEIVAKLQNKIGKFGLIQDDHLQKAGRLAKDIEEEALAVLMQLEYKKPEALAMIKKAFDHNSAIETTEHLLNEVYKQKKVL